MHWNNTLRGFIGGFSSRCEPASVYVIDSPIVRRSILSYRLSRCGETIVVTYQRCAMARRRLLVSLSFFFILFSSIRRIGRARGSVLSLPLPPSHLLSLPLFLISSGIVLDVARHRLYARAHPFALRPPTLFPPLRYPCPFSSSLKG